jgi:prepilin peptidase CpaA
MIFAALSDLLTQLIPNRISFLLMGTFLTLAALLQISWYDLGLHLACGFAVLSFAFTLFSLGWIGGGDGKLAAAVAVWLGFPMLLEYIVTVSLFGGLVAVLLVIFRRFPLPAAFTRIDWVMRLHDENGAVPYGIAISLAALHLYPQSLIWIGYMQSAIR